MNLDEFVICNNSKFGPPNVTEEFPNHLLILTTYNNLFSQVGVTIKTLLWCYLNYIKNLQLYFMLKLLIEVFLKILSRSNLQISIQKFLLILGLSAFQVIPNVLVNVGCVKIHQKTLTWDENPQWDFWHPMFSI